MHELYGLVKSIPSDMKSLDSKSFLRTRFFGFNRIPINMIFQSQDKEGLATFESGGIKIKMPFCRCQFGELLTPCEKNVFRKNRCFLRHGGLSSWCRQHDSPSNCHRCFAAGYCQCESCGVRKYPGQEKPFFTDGCHRKDGKQCVNGLSGTMCSECAFECIRDCMDCGRRACDDCGVLDFCEKCHFEFCEDCRCRCEEKTGDAEDEDDENDRELEQAP